MQFKKEWSDRMRHSSVLVFPCGSEVGLEINKSLQDISFIKLYGGASVPDHGKWEYENYIGNIPYITDKSFVEKLNMIIEEYHIDFIFPALDSVALVLSELRDSINATILTSCRETVNICRSKSKTYEALEGCDFLPGVYSKISDIDFPVFMKPAVGQGAQGARLIHSKEELDFELSQTVEEQVLCEYLPGKEYTVDCFTDMNGILKYCAHRSRNRIKSGISVNSQLEAPNSRVNEIANSINQKLKFKGAWFFQLKEAKNGQLKLMEVATRIAGTMCIERARGVNLPLLTVFDAMGYEVEISPQFDNVEVDRALTNCYKLNFKFDELYIDYDDTVIIRDKVNLKVISLLYKCVDQDIPIYLITKHHKDIFQELKIRKISVDLFKEIIHIEKGDDKSKYIRPSKNALFIDDSFAERSNVSKKLGIKSIGVDNIEVLLNGVRQ